jgi:hypothetical protein
VGVRAAARLRARQEGGLDVGHRGRAGRRRAGNPGYQGAAHAKTPYRGKNKPQSQKEANRAYAKLRSPGERANAQLKTWRILRKLRCCPWRAGQLARPSTCCRSTKLKPDEKAQYFQRRVAASPDQYLVVGEALEVAEPDLRAAAC